MTIIKSVRRKLKRLPQGEPFTINQLIGADPHTAVRKHLSGLAKKGAIRRIARGIYILRSAEMSSITPEKVAAAVASLGRYRARLIWTDSESRSVFITDGPARRIHMGKHAIEMRHLSPHAFDRYRTTSAT